MPRLFRLLPLLLLVVGLAACEIADPLQDVNLVLDVDDAEVDVPPIGIHVAPGAPAVVNETVSPDLADIDDIRDLEAIRLEPRFFGFQADAGKQAASGKLRVVASLGGTFPLPGMPVTVTVVDNVVTDVTPSTLSFEGSTYTLDVAGVRAVLAKLGPNAPSFGDFENATLDQVEASVNTALQSAGMPVVVIVDVMEGDLSGTMTVSGFTLDAKVALAR